MPSQVAPTRTASQDPDVDPGQTRPPIPWELVALVAYQMMKEKEAQAALLVLVMFEAYLRPGEALQLRQEDLVMPTAHHPFYCLNLHPSERLETSKVGLSDESVALDSQTIPWLGLALKGQLTKNHKDFMFDLTYRDLRGIWERALTSIGLKTSHAVLYQLRHSGPSHDRLIKSRSLLEVKKRGRWSSDSSVKRYEAHARVGQEFQKLPKRVQVSAIQAPKQLQVLAQRFFCQRKRKT